MGSEKINRTNLKKYGRHTVLLILESLLYWIIVGLCQLVIFLIAVAKFLFNKTLNYLKKYMFLKFLSR